MEGAVLDCNERGLVLPSTCQRGAWAGCGRGWGSSCSVFGGELDPARGGGAGDGRHLGLPPPPGALDRMEAVPPVQGLSQVPGDV